MEIDDDIKNDLAYYGYSKYDSDFFDSNDYNMLCNYFGEKLNINPPIFYFNFFDKKNLIKYGKYFLNKHLGEDFNKKVRYIDYGSINNKIKDKFGLNPKKHEYEKVVDYIKKKSKFVNVYNIPITFLAGNDWSGIAVTYEFNRLFDDSELLKKIPIIESHIMLDPYDDLTKITYIHELYHMLSYKNKGYTDNYLYEELLSIFEEKVSSMELGEKELDFENVESIYGLYDSLMYRTSSDDFYGIKEAQKYILGYTLSENLFHEYSNGNNKIKKEIDNYIKKIISGKIKLEDLIEHFNLTPEEGAKLTIDNYKRYVKKWDKVQKR